MIPTTLHRFFQSVIILTVLFAAPLLHAQAKYAGTYTGTISTRVTVPVLGTTESQIGFYSAVVAADGKLTISGTAITGTVSSTGVVTFKAEATPVLGLTKGKIESNKLSTEFADGKLLGSGTSRYRLNPSTSFISSVQKPVITVPPAATTVKVGNALTLKVTATGSSLKYQWQKNGVNIPDATAATFKISATTAKSAGKYRVIVKNTAGSATSTPAVVTINVAPTNLAPPTGTTATTVSFSGTVVDSLEGTFADSFAFRVISATTVKGPGYAGTYEYTRTGATTGKITYKVTITDGDFVEIESGTVILTYTSAKGGTYRSSGKYTGTDTTDDSTYAGTFTGSGTFQVTAK